ncbi:MAG TPA: hypothetical protein VII56_16080 [Rhizomicrobium sp.]
MTACCGFKAFQFPQPAGAPVHTPMSTAKISGIVIRAGEARAFLSLPLGPDNDTTWKQLDKVRGEIVYRACYCSVFDECWISTLRNLGAMRVDRCPMVDDLYTE